MRMRVSVEKRNILIYSGAFATKFKYDSHNYAVVYKLQGNYF